MNSEALFTVKPELELLILHLPEGYEIRYDDDSIVKAAIVKLQELGYLRVMIDLRNDPFKSRAIDPLSRSEMFRRYQLNPLTRMGWLLQTITPVARHYENVLHNRGWLVKMFEQEEGAMEWILDSE